MTGLLCTYNIFINNCTKHNCTKGTWIVGICRSRKIHGENEVRMHVFTNTYQQYMYQLLLSGFPLYPFSHVSYVFLFMQLRTLISCMIQTKTTPHFQTATALGSLMLSSLSTGSFSPITGSILFCKYGGHKQHSLGRKPQVWWLNLSSSLAVCAPHIAYWIILLIAHPNWHWT